MKRPLLLRGIRQLVTLRGPATPRRGRRSPNSLSSPTELLIEDGRMLSRPGSRIVSEARKAENFRARAMS